ncbi:melanocortin-2 receptor accessory protein [Pseudophryne corroboree]|uniref:melanocortin-2 receptor accessory protein n=1 Tax=Pseudophryne corroboree TaxID=495146 RepID=UPI003081E46A
MGRSGNSTIPNYTLSYEYYFDYVDPLPFDERELKASKYSIIIAVWVGLAAFSVFLFLILLYMSRTDSVRTKYTARRNRLTSAADNVEALEGIEEHQRCTS